MERAAIRVYTEAAAGNIDQLATEQNKKKKHTHTRSRVLIRANERRARDNQKGACS